MTAAALLATAATCDSSWVPRPTSDSSAPAIRLNVTGTPHANITMLPGGNPGATVLSGSWQTINMGGIAEDPQGVKDVIIEGDVFAHCNLPGSTTAQVEHYYRKATNPDGGGSSVLTRRSTLLFHQGDDFTTCQPSFVYAGHEAVYKAMAVNFSNTTVTTATYTVNHTP